MSIKQVVEGIKAEFFTTDLAVGKVVEHPTHGRVIITSGKFWAANGRLSNFWSWRKVNADDAPYGAVHSGYGWM